MFSKVANKLISLEKSPWDFGTGEKLFPSEIHVVEAIGMHPGINMKDLGSVMGISKPAVTQIIGKVTKKDLVERYNSRGNLKEVLLKLTSKGQVAFRGHREFHARVDTNIIHRFKKLATSEYDFLSQLFNDMAMYFDQIIEERNPEIVRSHHPAKRGEKDDG